MLAIIRSGIAAASKEISLISNNIANANTNGFKRSSSQFQDVYGIAGEKRAATQIGMGTVFDSARRNHAQGAFKTSVSIASQYSGEPLLKVTLDLLKGEIQAVDFPYRLQLATGRIVIDNNETILLSGFKTAGGPGAQVSFDGSLRRVNDTRKLDYRLLIADFKLDEKFRVAFPAQYQNFLGNLASVRKDLAIATIDCHFLSTIPFLPCRFGGAARICVPWDRNNAAAFPPINL